MQATDILQSEHRVIERVLAALATGAAKAESGTLNDAGFFVRAAYRTEKALEKRAK